MPRSDKQRLASAKMYKSIVELNDARLTDKEIAEHVGCSVTTVERARRAAGLKKVPPHKGRVSKLTPEVRAWLKANWQRCTDQLIGQRFGVTASTAEKWRAELGLYYGHKGKWTRYPHPKGFAGGTHSPETRAKVSASGREAWADPNSTFNTKEFRQRRGGCSVKGLAEEV